MVMADGPQKTGFSRLSTDARYSPAWRLFREYSTVPAEMEPLLALKPDLVVLDSFGQSALADMLKKAGIATYTMPVVEHLADVPDMVMALGHVLEQDEKAVFFASLWQERWVKEDKWGNNARPVPAWYVQPGYAAMPNWVGEALTREGYDAQPASMDVERFLTQPKPLLVVGYEGASLAQEWGRHPAVANAGIAMRGIKGNAVLCPHPDMIDERGWKPWAD